MTTMRIQALNMPSMLEFQVWIEHVHLQEHDHAGDVVGHEVWPELVLLADVDTLERPTAQGARMAPQNCSRR